MASLTSPGSSSSREPDFDDGSPVSLDAQPGEWPRVVFRRDGDAYLAVVPLPGADPAQLEVAKVEDELTITTGLRRRSLKLPRRMASLVLEAARLDGTSLKVRLRRAGTT